MPSPAQNEYNYCLGEAVRACCGYSESMTFLQLLFYSGNAGDFMEKLEHCKILG